MDTSGNIRELMGNEIPISNDQAKKLKRVSYKGRKNWMRNKKCKCGSGKKLKKCCWSKMAKTVIER